MILQINTPNCGIYSYEKVEFVLGEKTINREIAKENLLKFRKCLNDANITFGLIYGTLLGAIREKNFIEHDEDTDVFVLNEDRDKILDILFELKKVGLVVGRYEEDMISFINDGEYIDIYFFKDTFFGKKTSNGLVIESKYLTELKNIDFLGKQFLVPKQSEELLAKIYGEDWMIPMKDNKGYNFGLYRLVKNYIKNNFYPLFKIISRIKKLFNIDRSVN